MIKVSACCKTAYTLKEDRRGCGVMVAYCYKCGYECALMLISPDEVKRATNINEFE